jgi:hypothetical protein
MVSGPTREASLIVDLQCNKVFDDQNDFRDSPNDQPLDNATFGHVFDQIVHLLLEELSLQPSVDRLL